MVAWTRSRPCRQDRRRGAQGAASDAGLPASARGAHPKVHRCGLPRHPQGVRRRQVNVVAPRAAGGVHT
eukprot:358464-Chlamydomonas_euryale.AAC.2